MFFGSNFFFFFFFELHHTFKLTSFSSFILIKHLMCSLSYDVCYTASLFSVLIPSPARTGMTFKPLPCSPTEMLARPSSIKLREPVSKFSSLSLCSNILLLNPVRAPCSEFFLKCRKSYIIFNSIALWESLEVICFIEYDISFVISSIPMQL